MSRCTRRFRSTTATITSTIPPATGAPRTTPRAWRRACRSTGRPIRPTSTTSPGWPPSSRMAAGGMRECGADRGHGIHQQAGHQHPPAPESVRQGPEHQLPGAGSQHEDHHHPLQLVGVGHGKRPANLRQRGQHGIDRQGLEGHGRGHHGHEFGKGRFGATEDRPLDGFRTQWKRPVGLQRPRLAIMMAYRGQAAMIDCLRPPRRPIRDPSRATDAINRTSVEICR